MNGAKIFPQKPNERIEPLKGAYGSAELDIGGMPQTDMGLFMSDKGPVGRGHIILGYDHGGKEAERNLYL